MTETNKEIIITASGRAVNPFALRGEDICIEDIAASLSRQCRFNGHTNEHYSVAQHSMHVAQYLGHKRFGDRLVFAALLHDASEAYIGDMVRPVKINMPDFARLEDDIQTKIWRWAGLEVDAEDRRFIDAVDSAIIANEARAFFPPRAWRSWPQPYIGLPLHFKLEGWPPALAERRFLQFYRGLKKALNKEAAYERDY